MNYKITFEDDRLGRGEPTEPFVVEANNLDQVAEAVYFVANQKLLSSVIDVEIDHNQGFVIVGGWRTIAKFTVEEVS